MRINSTYLYLKCRHLLWRSFKIVLNLRDTITRRVLDTDITTAKEGYPECLEDTYSENPSQLILVSENSLSRLVTFSRQEVTNN